MFINCLSSQELLLLTKFFSFAFKLYFLIIIVNQFIKSQGCKKFHLLLTGILAGSIMYSDVSWIPYHIYKIYLPHLDMRIVGFMARLGWLFFIIQNQSLILFLDNITKKIFNLERYHVVFLLTNFILILFQIYFIVLKFNSPLLEGDSLLIEQRLIQLECLHLVVFFVPTLYRTIQSIRLKNLPKILSHQLKVFLGFLVFPHLLLDLVTKKLLFFTFI